MKAMGIFVDFVVTAAQMASAGTGVFAASGWTCAVYGGHCDRIFRHLVAMGMQIE